MLKYSIFNVILTIPFLEHFHLCMGYSGYSSCGHKELNMTEAIKLASLITKCSY